MNYLLLLILTLLGGTCFGVEEKPIWVSLTTIPSRLSRVNLTLASLKNQSLQPDLIILCLPEICLKENATYELPFEILNDPAITIIRCANDWGPATKLLGCLAECHDPETRIIVVDDDIIYPYDLVEKLVARSDSYPHAAIGFCGWNVADLLKGRDYFYSHLIYEDRIPNLPFVSKADVLEGYRGVLTKRKFWDDAVYAYSDAPKRAFYVDDVWFSGHLARKKIARLAFKYEPQKTLSTWDTYRTIWKATNSADDTNALSKRPDFLLSNQETALYFGPKCWKIK